jgi:hypothetical protein
MRSLLSGALEEGQRDCAHAHARQLEMLNVFMGFEQANRYAIYTTDVSSNNVLD